MIIVNTLDEFQMFIDMAKQQNLSYSVIGSECDDEKTFSFGETDTELRARYVLLCPAFTVYVSAIIKTNDDKQTITNISSISNFTAFKHITLIDGNISCYN